MKVVSLKAAKAARERKQYAALVLNAYDRQEHDSKREAKDKAAEVRRAARNRT